VKIYDLTGRLLESDLFDNSDVKAGNDLSNGMYIAKIEVNGEVKQIVNIIKNQ